MNNQLLEKIITSDNFPCPEFTYSNPLLDVNVAKALSKSFVKILNLSQQNSNVSNNLRLSILEKIRKICRTEPENHARIDENMTNLLSELYNKNIETHPSDSVDRSLDAFLLRKMKETNISSSHEPSVNPEIIQALINLNQNGVYLETLSQDIIHWNCTNNKYIQVLKDFWTNDRHKSLNANVSSDISIKLKTEIEQLLLENCHFVLSNRNVNIEEFISSNKPVINIISKSANSAESFQICSSILNFLFIMTNYDSRIHNFILTFVKLVKQNCPHITFSVLYPLDINPIVVLLDFDIQILPPNLRNDYIKSTIKYLCELQSEKYLVLLLSHFPQWFDVYSSYRHERFI